MALMYSSASKLGSKAPPFNLPGVDGKHYTLDSFHDQKALLVIFMCNHCPYVIAVQDRINDLAKKYASQGLAVIGINPNDPEKYPEDSMDAMKVRARVMGYQFAYVQDLTQEVAKEYDAVCTPDPFLYENVNGDFLLRYRGRIDDSWKDPAQVKKQDLAEAIEAIIKKQSLVGEQTPSMGCSIKWR
ncbi:MAG: thioredoxin family protein [Xanthomonadaceae bacterium]|nr:thioredoxin family protein [Xanthomonadaceae bacterium]